MGANPAERIAALRAEIRRHDTLYYTHGAPEIPDVAYDKKFAELQQLEVAHPDLLTAHSPTQRVGGEPIDGLTTVKHLSPMLSIDNGFEMEVLDKFHARVTKTLGKEPDYTADWKIDGCAVGLVYKDGKLIRMVSRGDGKKGDDITHNAASIRGIPQTLTRLPLKGLGEDDHVIKVDGIVEVRGEAYIPNSVFRKIVASQEKAGQEPFKNSRNAASGALRQLDPTECYRRGLHFMAHGIGQFDPEYIDDSYQRTMWGLHVLGVPLVEYGMGGLPYVAVQKHIEQMILLIDGIDFPVDGIVLKLDCFSDREALGQVSSRHVSWALAYKWERYEAETKIVRLETQVGKQGTLTPVAYYEPVEIAETTVEKSTLFNFDEVERMDPRLGDTVTLEKAGKIIPHLVRVHKDKRTGKPRKFKPPMWCPICQAQTAREGPLVFCTNTAGCPAQLGAVLLAAGHRSRLDIDGLGPVAIKAMMRVGAIEDLASLWALRDAVSDSGAIPGMTPGKSKKLLAALEGAKTRPSWNLLASLNIKHCGRTNSELICKAIQSYGLVIMGEGRQNLDVFDRLACHWGRNDLMALEGVGKETAQAIVNWFGEQRNLGLVDRLRAAGLNTGIFDPKPEAAPAGPRPLDDKHVCATGRLQHFTRESVKSAITAAGGTVASSVSSKTDYLVAGEAAGSKLAKAEQLGVRILSESEFVELISTG